MSATDDLLDAGARDRIAEARYRNYCAVVAAAHRAVAEAFDADPTPPYGIVRPVLRRVDGGRS